MVMLPMAPPALLNSHSSSPGGPATTCCGYLACMPLMTAWMMAVLPLLFAIASRAICCRTALSNMWVCIVTSAASMAATATARGASKFISVARPVFTREPVAMSSRRWFKKKAPAAQVKSKPTAEAGDEPAARPGARDAPDFESREFSLMVHGIDFSDLDIVINPEYFPEVRVEDVLEICVQGSSAPGAIMRVKSTAPVRGNLSIRCVWLCCVCV